jgi:hypothetical protein
MKLALPVLLGAATLAACAPPPPAPGAPPAPMASAASAASTRPAPPQSPGSGCFYSRDIVSHEIADDHTMLIRLRSNRVFRLEMVGSCLAAVNRDDPIVIREPPGIPYICRAVDFDISIARNAGLGGIPTPCIVNTLTELTPAQVAALPRNVRP